MQCVDTVKVDSRRTSQTDVDSSLSRLQQFLDVHPSPLTAHVERHAQDMLASISNLSLDEMWSTAVRRYKATCGLC